MKDIAFHLTDIVENGIRAGADRIAVRLLLEGDDFTVSIADNGRGMEAATLRQVTNPFYTTRNTRRVGLGLPFLFQNAEQCGGRAEIHSRPGQGTEVEAHFPLRNIDCPPTGDLAGTLMQIIVGNPGIELSVDMRCEGRTEGITRRELIEVLDGVPLGHPKVAILIREMLASLMNAVFGDRLH